MCIHLACTATGACHTVLLCMWLLVRWKSHPVLLCACAPQVSEQLPENDYYEYYEPDFSLNVHGGWLHGLDCLLRPDA
jgi:hypothetical protein